jgi:clan AA aspartic protease
MRLALARVKLANSKLPELAPIEVNALADARSINLCIPEQMARQLKFEELDRREQVLPNGARRTVSYVGPVSVSFGSRVCFTGALVLGDEPLLGLIPMEDMDLVISPESGEVVVNRATPILAVSIAKGLPPDPRSR